MHRPGRLPALAIVGLVVIALFGAACSAGSSSSDSSPQNPPGPPTSERGPEPVSPGGSLSFAMGQEPASFNLNTSRGRQASTQLLMDRVWPQVFLIDSQGVPQLDTNFVSSAELDSISPQTIVYQIADKATWSDGVPITADDFIYNWQAQSGDPAYTDVGGKPFQAASTAGYSQIQSVTGSNHGKTVTVVFKTPYGDWKSLFNNLIPVHIARTVGWNNGFDAFGPAIISGGPYMVQSDRPGQQIVLARNPHYWGPPAHLDTIVLRSIPNPGQDLAALQSGQVNLIYPPPQFSLVQQAKPIRDVTKSTGLGYTFEHLDFNQRNQFLKMLPVRQAIAKAIDRQQLINASVGQIDPDIKPDNNRLYVNNQQGYQDNGAGYEQPDVAGARKLLQGAGFTPGPDGYFQLGGQTLEMRIATSSDDPLRVTTESAIVGQLQKAGIKVDPTNSPTTTLLGQVLPSGNFDLALFGSVSSVFASDNASIYETPAGGRGSLNYDSYSDPRVDSLFDQANTELNAGTAANIYNQIDQQLWADMVTLPLYQDPTFIAYGSNYLNIADNPSSSGPFWNAEQWGFKPPAQTR